MMPYFTSPRRFGKSPFLEEGMLPRRRSYHYLKLRALVQITLLQVATSLNPLKDRESLRARFRDRRKPSSTHLKSTVFRLRTQLNFHISNHFLLKMHLQSTHQPIKTHLQQFLTLNHSQHRIIKHSEEEVSQVLLAVDIILQQFKSHSLLGILT